MTIMTCDIYIHNDSNDKKQFYNDLVVHNNMQLSPLPLFSLSKIQK